MGFDTVAQRQYIFTVFVPSIRAVREVLRAFHDDVHGAQKRFLFAQDECQPADMGTQLLTTAMYSSKGEGFTTEERTDKSYFKEPRFIL